LITRLTTS